MRAADTFWLSGSALLRYPLRTAMMLLATAIGVAAVIILTGLGEGARRFVTGEFASLGTHLVIVIPGRTETTGGGPALLAGETPRDLTLADAIALKRSTAVAKIAPVVLGSASASWGGLEREVPVLGSTTALLEVRHWQMEEGKFIPDSDPSRATSVVVIGGKVRDEIFGPESAIGKWLRLGDRRFRVIGVLATEGRAIGLDVQELVVIPVASAQALFNSPSLFRIIVSARSRDAMSRATKDIRTIITERHRGEEDVTVITQDAVLQTFDTIFAALTMTLAGIASISLAVAGVLIMNVMLVAVAQRTAEIGLLKALGGSARQITRIFLTEAVLLSLFGGVIGLGLGFSGVWLIKRIYPAFPASAPYWAVIAALVIAVGSGIVFGILPARRAARLDPVDALAGK